MLTLSAKWFYAFYCVLVIRNFVSPRLCARDSHQLFQRLESHARDYILEVKVRLLQQLTSGHETPQQAKAFVSLMLDEYSDLCISAKILSEIFNQLVMLLLSLSTILAVRVLRWVCYR